MTTKPEAPPATLRKQRLVYIHWKDAAHSKDDFEEDRIKLADLHEVGWLVKETEEAVTVAVEWDPEADPPSRRLWLAIPKVNIIEMKTVEFGKAFPAGRPRAPKAPKVKPEPATTLMETIL